MKLHWQILIAIGVAIGVGLCLEPKDGIGEFTFYALFQFLGTLFLNALKMIVVPLIMSSIICGVASTGGGDALGRMGFKTIGMFFLSTLCATLMGLVLVNITNPGLIDGQPAREQLNLTSGPAVQETLSKVDGHGAGDVAEIFLRMVPTNLVAAAAGGEMIGLIFFAFLFGYFMMRIEPQYSQVLHHFWRGIFEVMMKITMLVMKFAPIGVFALVAKTVMATGFAAFKPLLVFFFTVALGLALHFSITLALMLRVVGRVNPLLHYRAMFPAILTAFSSASSAASLPVNIRCLEDNVGVSTKTSSFVLSLGATINMDGTALYECVAALFIAQAYGLELSFAQQFMVVVLALFTSMGVAGIPAASLVAISVILTAMGLPLEGIGLLLVTDRILDMLRTAINVFSDSVVAVVVAGWEGERDLYRNREEA